MDEGIMSALNGAGTNHILPFLWMTGEDINVTIAEMRAAHACGIRAVCLESRTFEDFCGETWWTTIRRVLEEARALGMKVWVLDDKHFPTGYACGLIKNKYPERCRLQLGERHADVIGPRRADFMVEGFRADDTLIGAVAMKRADTGERLTGESVVLTPENGYVSFDCPEGCWRVFTFWTTHAGGSDEYINMLDESSVDVLIEAVYESHYAHVGEYFGRELAGFFSDEPSLGNGFLIWGTPSRGMYDTTLGQPGLALPWSVDMDAGDITRLPLLWFDGDGFEEVRERYMDKVTRLYGRRFNKRLGDWCRAHGVEYIGHIIEDNGAHARLGCSCGHYFRSLEWQDMSGIDIVLHQVMPGFAEHDNACIASGGKVDSKFFHYTLGMLASSLAHIRSGMKNRAMCEVFGAYGWAEDLPVMKWLIDHLLVRGVNMFVPHAFSPKYPNEDCPPHFYADGENPQFDDFAALMRYTNTAADILAGNRAVHIAVLYHAEAEWSGRGYMPVDDVAEELMRHQIGFDFVPADDAENAVVINGKWHVGNAAFDTLVVPGAEYLPEKVIGAINGLRAKGIRVVQPCALTPGLRAEYVPLKSMHTALGSEVVLSREYPLLRYFRAVREDGSNVVMFFNEDTVNPVDTVAEMLVSGGYAKIDLLGGSVTRGVSHGSVKLRLMPYESVIFVFDGAEDGADPEPAFETAEVSPVWTIETARCEAPSEYTTYARDVRAPETVEKRLPDFAGKVRYTARVNVSGVKRLRLTDVGDTALVTVNGIPCGRRFVMPYVFDVSAAWTDGENEVVIEVSTTLARKHRDPFSAFMAMNRPGLGGAVFERAKE